MEPPRNFMLTGDTLNFNKAVLRALPHDIDPNIADGWRNNTGALAKVLREALLPPDNPATEAVRFPSPNRTAPHPRLHGEGFPESGFHGSRPLRRKHEEERTREDLLSGRQLQGVVPRQRGATVCGIDP